MPPLIQLKNGDWIDPATVTALRVLDHTEGFAGGYHSPRLVVETRAGGVSVVEYPDLEDAIRARDALAGAALAARE